MNTPEENYSPRQNPQRFSRRSFLGELGKTAITATVGTLLLERGNKSTVNASPEEQSANPTINPFLIDSNGNQKLSTLIADEKFVVWSEISNMGQQIILKNLETNANLIITADTCAELGTISNGNLIYAKGKDNNSSEIHIFNLSKATDTLTSATEAGIYKKYPCLNKNTAFWVEDQNGQSCLKGYDLSSNQQFDIPAGNNPKIYTVVDQNTLVWTELVNKQWNLITYDLNTKQIKQWTAYNGNLGKPSIDNGMIAYTKNPIMVDQMQINPSELHLLNILTGQDNILPNPSQTPAVITNYRNPAISNGWLTYTMEQEQLIIKDGLPIALPPHIMLTSLIDGHTFTASKGNGEDFPSIYQDKTNPNNQIITWAASTDNTFETTIMGANVIDASESQSYNYKIYIPNVAR